MASAPLSLEADADAMKRMAPGQRHLFLHMARALRKSQSTMDCILRIIRAGSASDPTPSGRLLYWVATNFSKATGLHIVHSAMTTNVHDSYNARLREWNRHSFDPFCRQGSPVVRIGGVASTLAQVHFLYWATVTGVATFTRRNSDKIGKHQEAAMRRVRDRKAKGNPKRSQISAPPRRTSVGFEFVHDPRNF